MSDNDQPAASPRLPPDSPREDDSQSPPDTILVRHQGELLLLDAWTTEGNKLRTPPNLIGEAVAHFRLPKEISDYRLAVHERVDGKLALLFLGISALRFIENGRVLELVDVSAMGRRNRSHISHPNSTRSKDPHDTWPTAGANDDEEGFSDSSSTSSSIHSTGSFRTPQDTPLHTPDQTHAPESIPLPRSSKSRASGRSSRDPVVTESRSHRTSRSGRTDDSAYVYIHPRYGSLFRQQKSRNTSFAAEPPTPGLHSPRGDLASLQDELDAHSPMPRDHLRTLRTFDFRTAPAAGTSNLPSALMTPVEDVALNPLAIAELGNRPSSPLLPPSQPTPAPFRRVASHSSHLSRATSPLSGRKPDDDPWLSSQGSESWKETHLQEQQTLPRSTRRFRSHETTRPTPVELSNASAFGLPRPMLLHRAYSSATVALQQERRHKRGSSGDL